MVARSSMGADSGFDADSTVGGDSQDVAEALDIDMIAGEAGLDGDVRNEVPPDRPTIISMPAPPGDIEDTGAQSYSDARDPGSSAAGSSADGMSSHGDSDRHAWGMRIMDPTDVDVEELDDEAEAIGVDSGDTAELSAEEQAMHLTADPPMGHLGDGYV